MGLNKLIQYAAILAVLAASSGQLPRIINTVRKAQLELIQDSKASRWGQAMLLPINN
jgi:hypothetical protein